MTTAETFDVTGADGSGEVEFVLRFSSPGSVCRRGFGPHRSKSGGVWGYGFEADVSQACLSRAVAVCRDEGSLGLPGASLLDNPRSPAGALPGRRGDAHALSGGSYRALHGWQHRRFPSGRQCSAAPCLCWYRSGPRPNSRWNSKTLCFTARYAIGTACASYPTTTEEGGGRWRFKKNTRSFIPST